VGVVVAWARAPGVDGRAHHVRVVQLLTGQ
jgi:hypothetical protein